MDIAQASLEASIQRLMVLKANTPRPVRRETAECPVCHNIPRVVEQCSYCSASGKIRKRVYGETESIGTTIMQISLDNKNYINLNKK